MIQATDIKGLRFAAGDYKEAEFIKANLRRIRKERNPFFLTKCDLKPIFKWKLRNQIDRVKRHLEKNSDRAYEVITQAAFSINEDDWKLESELRIGVLTALHGVGVPIASAILALAEPSRYCVIDFRGWRAVFDEKRSAFDISFYIRYITVIRQFALELGWPIQETDMAVWEYDRSSRSSKKRTA